MYWLESQQQSEFTVLSLSLFSSLLVSLALSRHFLNSSSFSLFYLSFLSLSLFLFLSFQNSLLRRLKTPRREGKKFVRFLRLGRELYAVLIF